jgi:hypothetical protein
MNSQGNLFFWLCLFLSSCTNTSSRDGIQLITVNNADSSIIGVKQNGKRIGTWNELDKKRDVRRQSFYGYGKRYGCNDTFEIQLANYFYKDSPVMELVFQNGFIKDADIKKLEYVSTVYPFVNNYFGEQLFYTNCGNCHAWNYSYESEFSKLVKSKYEDGSLEKLIKEGRRPKYNDPLLLQHPEMYHLDTFEISAIVKFVTVMDTSIITSK